VSTIYVSPIASVRIPARREREHLARRILGQLVWPDGELRPGTEDEQKEARKWLVS